MADWSATHQCPDCGRTLKPVSHWQNVCPMCGQLVPDIERGRRFLAKAFTAEPEPEPPAPPEPLIRTSTAGKRKSRPGPGQGALL